MMRSKKAILFNISLVIVTIIVLTTALITLDQANPFRQGIGSKAFDAVVLYQKAETSMFYADQSAKLSAQQTAYDLAQKGGFYNESKCGEKEGYAIWSDGTDKDCYPEYKTEFQKKFNDIMKEYLNPLLPSSAGYELSFIDKMIIGVPQWARFFSGIYGSSKNRLSFNINIGYDINEYKDLITKAENLVSECNNDIGCVNNKADEYKWNLIEGTENIFKFSAETDTKVLVKNAEDEVSYESITYKFALYVPVNETASASTAE